MLTLVPILCNTRLHILSTPIHYTNDLSVDKCDAAVHTTTCIKKVWFIALCLLRIEVVGYYWIENMSPCNHEVVEGFVEDLCQPRGKLPRNVFQTTRHVRRYKTINNCKSEEIRIYPAIHPVSDCEEISLLSSQLNRRQGSDVSWFHWMVDWNSTLNLLSTKWKILRVYFYEGRPLSLLSCNYSIIYGEYG